LVTRLVPGGLMAMGPTCSTFVWPNSSNNQRLEVNGWAGDPGCPPTHTGNLEAEIAWFFLCLAVCRSVEAFIENPLGSSMVKYLRSREGLQSLSDRVPHKGECVTWRCAFVDEEPIGTRIKKGFRFVATGAWIEAARRACPCQGALHRLCMTKDHKGRSSGNLDIMRESQSYPPALGQALVSAWWHGQQAASVLPVAPPVRGVPGVPGVLSGKPAAPARPQEAAGHGQGQDLPFSSVAKPGRAKTATTLVKLARCDDDLPFSQGRKRGPATPLVSQSLPFDGQPSCKRPAAHHEDADELPFGC